MVPGFKFHICLVCSILTQREETACRINEAAFSDLGVILHLEARSVLEETQTTIITLELCTHLIALGIK
jgi:hypothetical protein